MGALVGCLGWQSPSPAAGATAPFAPVRGTYFGLFTDTDTGTTPRAGGFTFTATAAGSVSGVWQMNGERLTVSGRLDADGHFSQTMVRAKLNPITVALRLDVATDSPQVTGSVSDGVWTATLTGYRVAFDGTRNVAPQAGRYTVMIAGDAGASNAPCGDSYGTLSVSKSGAVRLSGALADGTKFTHAAGVSPDGQWPLYAPLYGRQGWLWSWLTFTNPPTGELGGDLSWVKPPMERAPYYPNGFARTVAARGTAYFPVQHGTRRLGSANISLRLSGGALAQDLVLSGSLHSGSRVAFEDHSSLNLSPGTGTFRGSARNPLTHQPMPFSGVVLQRKGVGCGWFLGQGLSGRVHFVLSSGTGYVAQFQTLGPSFAAEVEVDSTFGETSYWTWSDGSVSSDYPNVARDFGSAGPRQQTLTVSPTGAVLAINIGFDQIDGGEDTPLPLMAPQNVGAVYFPAPLPGLRYWASAYAPIANTLDFSGFNSLEIVECYQCARLEHVVLSHLPSLRRACVEACNLQELDISGDPNLEDLRAALNQYTKIVVGEGTGPKLQHWCTRDNPQLTQHLQDIQKNCFSLMECFMWNDNQSGALSFVSTNLVDVDVHDNQYSSADFSGHVQLRRCWVYDNRLTDLVFTTCASLRVLDAHQNQLPTQVLDRLLELLDTGAPNLVEVDLSQNAGPPSSAGYVHYQNLLNRGVSVKVD